MTMRLCLRGFIIMGLFLALGSFAARAVQPDEILPDAKLEARARGLSAQLRCMVCQNESIDDSNADLARDLRIMIREQLQAGNSDEQIRAAMVERYGDFILLKPPFKVETILLWGTPLLVLLFGAGGIFLVARRRPGAVATEVLSESETAHLNTVLRRDGS
jgi:cytochrome c-type biogenesis protein CcmH